MEKLNLTEKAKKSVKKLISSKDKSQRGCIAAVNPLTGDFFYGKSVKEAAKEGRKIQEDAKAVFFFVRVGFPSVHMLKHVRLQGNIEGNSFPNVKGHISEEKLHITSEPSGGDPPLNIIVDTGFSGEIVLDGGIIGSIERDYLGEDTVTLAGGVDYTVSVYLSDVIVNDLKLNEVEVTEMKGEYLLGITFMRSICKKAIFDFETDKISFEC